MVNGTSIPQTYAACCTACHVRSNHIQSVNYCYYFRFLCNQIIFQELIQVSRGDKDRTCSMFVNCLQVACRVNSIEALMNIMNIQTPYILIRVFSVLWHHYLVDKKGMQTVNSSATTVFLAHHNIMGQHAIFKSETLSLSHQGSLVAGQQGNPLHYSCMMAACCLQSGTLCHPSLLS